MMADIGIRNYEVWDMQKFRSDVYDMGLMKLGAECAGHACASETLAISNRCAFKL